MGKFRFLVSALVLAFLVGCSDSSVANSGEKLAGEKLSAIQADNKEKEKFLVVDVRTKDEYDKGHLKHAINIPLENLEARLDELKIYL